MAYKQILVAVDITDEAGEVLSVAAESARLHGATLHCITVVKPLVHVYGSLEVAAVSDSALNFERDAQQQAHEQLKALCAAHGIDADDTSVTIGSPAVEIKRAADAMAADLIVIGSRGRHGIGVLLGSTANAVLQSVTCDVLAVKVAAG